MADDSKVSEKPAVHYLGHRERLRERAAAGGLGALPDYEVLELHLFRSAKMGDVKPKAKALLARFGSLGAVLSASLPELMSVPGIGAVAALDLKLVHEMAQRIGREPAGQAHGDRLLVGAAVLCAGGAAARGARAGPGAVS